MCLIAVQSQAPLFQKDRLLMSHTRKHSVLRAVISRAQLALLPASSEHLQGPSYTSNTRETPIDLAISLLAIYLWKDNLSEDSNCLHCLLLGRKQSSEQTLHMSPPYRSWNKKQMCTDLANTFLHPWYMMFPCQHPLLPTLLWWGEFFLVLLTAQCSFVVAQSTRPFSFVHFPQPWGHSNVCEFVLFYLACSLQHSQDREQGLAPSRCSINIWWMNKYSNSHHYRAHTK